MAVRESEFETFFLDHYERVVRSLTAIIGDEHRARDCAQDAFVKASVRWRKVRRLDSPGAWVRRVAINRSRDLHRGDERRRRRESAVAGTDQVSGAEQSCVGSMRLTELLEGLPDRQRAAAALFYVDDLPVADIATILGISDGAVKFHLSAARKTLRAVIEQEGQWHGRR